MTIDFGKPSTWMRFKPSLCTDCKGGCCSLPVEVTAQDLLRMELVDEDEIRGSLKKVASRLQKQKIVQSFRSATGLFTLTQKPNGECLFLDKNRQCVIYFKRPQVCRDFPTVVGPRVGFCPYERR